MACRILQNTTGVDRMPILNDRELEKLGEGQAIYSGMIQRPLISIFWTSGNGWETHENPSGSKCASRIMLLFYPWRFDHIFCQWEPEHEKCPEDPDGEKVGHCVNHYDPTPYFICIDCNRVGVHRSREQYAKREEPCEIRPSNGGCITHSLRAGECARYGLGPKKPSPFKAPGGD